MATYSAPYLTQQMLTDRWGPDAMDKWFNDLNTGTLSTGGIVSVITGAQARTTAWFPDTYNGPLPFEAPIPELVSECSFEYALYFAGPRNPDYARSIGLDRAKQLAVADALGKQIQEAVLRLVDAPAPTPDNVGGDVGSNDPNVAFAPKPLFFLATMGDF